MIEWRSLAQNAEHQLRVSSYDHAQMLDLEWHEKQSIGNITAILNDDINQLERFLNNGVNQIIQVMVNFYCNNRFYIFLHIYCHRIYCYYSSAPNLCNQFHISKKKLSPRYKAIREKVAALNTLIINNLMGIQVIKSFHTFKHERDNLNKKSMEYQNENINAIAISSAFNPLISKIWGCLQGF